MGLGYCSTGPSSAGGAGIILRASAFQTFPLNRRVFHRFQEPRGRPIARGARAQAPIRPMMRLESWRRAGTAVEMIRCE